MNVPRITKQLRIDEAVRPSPYTDSVGKLTIGVGRNLTDKPLSPIEIDFLFENDLAEAVEDCRRMYQNFDALNDVRREVLVNMMFNMGFTTMRQFRKMRSAVEREDFEDAALEMLDSKWSQQVGARATRLARQMKTGVV